MKQDQGGSRPQKESGSGELQAALQRLELSCQPKQRPTRFHAREILLELGRRILAGETGPAESLAQKVAGITSKQQEVWVEAVREELTLACTEHVRSVDPRYLSRPDYDLYYVVDARTDLEARLRAAELLGIEPTPGLLARVVEADDRLGPFLRRRASQEGGQG